MDRDRVQDTLNRAFAADLTDLHRILRHLLKDLENVPVRTLVLVDGHPVEG
jgi:hypothetical protein